MKNFCKNKKFKLKIHIYLSFVFRLNLFLELIKTLKFNCIEFSTIALDVFELTILRFVLFGSQGWHSLPLLFKFENPTRDLLRLTLFNLLVCSQDVEYLKGNFFLK